MPETRRPVVVTRPLAQAAGLAARIAGLGRHAETFPLLDILPLADDSALRAELARLRDYALVAFVSPNAIEAAFARLPAWPDGVACAVVGQGSREALARHGVAEPAHRVYAPSHPTRTDSTTLLAELDLDALRGRRVLIVRGTEGREFLADALRDAGVAVMQAAAYRRAAPAWTPALGERLAALLAQEADWIVTSSEALRVALALARRSGGPDFVVKMQQQHLLVPHVRIAETAAALGYTRVTRAASGDDGLVAALQLSP